MLKSSFYHNLHTIKRSYYIAKYDAKKNSLTIRVILEHIKKETRIYTSKKNNTYKYLF